ncbi:AAA domain-containing protein [Aspergillus karnatakaensis]|uniref:ATP/GTP-binding protein n=1 Tax=Aspergillus karnatakaensis TaxID=1810916 RepID=UPI003CCDC1C8
MQRLSLYIVGAQCTGKTTLIQALQRAFFLKYPSLHMRVITEVARNVLQDYQFSRDDLTDNPERALELQQLILVAQYKEESKSSTDSLLCDRSGVDPIVYAIKYGPPQARQLLESASHWHYLRDRMRTSLVILCQPHQEWLADDGTRLMAKSWEEWESVHHIFVQVLETSGIGFWIIPEELLDLEARVDFVLRLWNNLDSGSLSTRT